MSRWKRYMLALMVSVAAVPTARAQPTAPRPMPESFQVLREKTMFSRQHVQPRPRVIATRPAEKPRPPVLIGIILEATGPAAVFESPSSGIVAEFHIGDDVPGEHGGKIQDMTLDYVELAGVGTAPARRVDIGQDLIGEGAALAAPTAGSSASTADSSSSTAPAAAGGGGSVLERLRARRQQELGK